MPRLYCTRDDPEVLSLAATGLLRRLVHDVYVPSNAVETVELRARGLRTALPAAVTARAVVCRGAAVWLWCGGPAPARLDVAQEKGRPRRVREPVTVHEQHLPEADRTAVAGVTVTTPLRTAFDALCLTVDDLEAEMVLSRLQSADLLDLPQLRRRCDRSAGARGLLRARVRAHRFGTPDPGLRQ